MAQLRDKITSEIVFEGTPLEVAVLGDAIGFDEVLFDDVGEAFDPKAVLKAYDDEISGSEAVAKSTKVDAEGKKRAADRVDEVRGAIKATMKNKAKVARAMQDARDAREKAMR